MTASSRPNSLSRASTVRRVLLAVILTPLTLGLAGCEWWLFINQNSNEMAEHLIDDRFGNDEGRSTPGDNPSVRGGAGGSGGSGGGGAASGSGGSDGSDEAGDPQEPLDTPDAPDPRDSDPLPEARIVAHIGGHRWDVRSLRITEVDREAVAFEAHLSKSGVPAAMRLVVPAQGWPRDAQGRFVTLEWSPERDGNERVAAMPTGEGLVLDARTHTLTPVQTLGSVVAEDDGSRLVGLIDAHSSRDAGAGHTVEQLVRIRFDAPLARETTTSARADAPRVE